MSLAMDLDDVQYSLLVEKSGARTQPPLVEWLKSARLYPLGGRRLQKAMLLGLTLAFALAVMFFTGKREHVPGPPPFYCSTWDSATPIFDEIREDALRDYNHWTKFDNVTYPFPQRVAPISNTASHPSILEYLSHNKASEPKGMAGSNWRKPHGFRIVAMIFFGRPHQVDILDCYLQQNMAHNGGYLDKVHFISHTTDSAALEWLDNLVAATPDYERIEVGPHCYKHPHSEDCRYERIWERYATDADTLYIKIDDDMVYIHPETIPRIVQKRLEYPNPYAVSANLINSPMTSWLHYHTGAIYPYLPELTPLSRTDHSPTWRATQLPIHPSDNEFHDLHFGPTKDTSVMNSAIPDDESLYHDFDLPAFPGHRWLPLTQNTTALLHTPISRGTVDPWGPSVHSWAIAAQQHYSLLQNIENQTLHKYWVAPVPPLGDGLWNTQYTRYNLNFIAVWGRDVVTGAGVRKLSDAEAQARQSSAKEKGFKDEWMGGVVSDMHDDEKNITADIPRASGRPMMIDVQALAAHMHFHDQEVGIQMTDLLDRWRAYVNENVCSTDRQKRVPGQVGGKGWVESNGGPGWWRCPWVA